MGSALSSGGDGSGASQPPGYMLVASAEMDAITCPAISHSRFMQLHAIWRDRYDRSHVMPALPKGPQCGLSPNPDSFREVISAEEFIQLMGYSKIHKVGQLFTPNGLSLWVFEVSKNQPE